MVFRRSDLQEAFFVPGTHAFRVWGYGTADPLADVLAPDYFAVARGLLHPGELIYVGARPPAGGNGAQQGEVRLALVMVRAEPLAPERADGSVRLVQDFGRPTDPAPTADAAAPATPAPVKRGRGRPRGSRTTKAREIPTANAPEPSPRA